MGSTIRSTSLLALLRQTKVSPVQASLGPKSMTALSKVWPCDLCMVIAQQSPSCRWWLQVGGVLQKKKGTYIQRTPPPMEKKKRKRKKREKKKEVPSTGIELANFNWISPPTLQRHELGKSIHATFLYPTSFLPADTRYIRIWYIIRTSLKPRLVEHTRRFFFSGCSN